MSAEQSIQYWSTRDVPQSNRFEYWKSHLRESMWPVSEWGVTGGDFSVDLQQARLGCLASLFESATGVTRARRTPSDVDNSAESCYVLFHCDSLCQWTHNGHTQTVHPNDVVLIGQGEHDSYMSPPFRTTMLKLPGHWVNTWLPDPGVLVGRAIPRDSKWGQVLAPMVSQLTPQVAAAPPLPHQVLVDQLGTMLALIAGQQDIRARPDLHNKIVDCIRHRCTEPRLTAADVADSLNIPVGVLHRVLAKGEQTFASQLLDARASVALRMLTSRACSELSTAQIGYRAGFLSPSHFGSVMFKRTGRTPQQLRSPCH